MVESWLGILAGKAWRGRRGVMIGHGGCVPVWRQTRARQETRALVQTRCHGCRQQQRCLVNSQGMPGSDGLTSPDRYRQ